MRRRIHACHMRRRIHACGYTRVFPFPRVLSRLLLFARGMYPPPHVTCILLLLLFPFPRVLSRLLLFASSLDVGGRLLFLETLDESVAEFDACHMGRRIHAIALS